MDNKPFTTVEIFFLGFVGVFADLIGIVGDWLGLVTIASWFVTFIMACVTQFYFRMKGVKGYYSLIGNVIELIPIINWLPAITVSLLATGYIANHPTSFAAKAVSKVGMATAKTRVVPAKAGLAEKPRFGHATSTTIAGGERIKTTPQQIASSESGILHPSFDQQAKFKQAA